MTVERSMRLTSTSFLLIILVSAFTETWSMNQFLTQMFLGLIALMLFVAADEIRDGRTYNLAGSQRNEVKR